jgi:hypothetical protein
MAVRGDPCQWRRESHNAHISSSHDVGGGRCHRAGHRRGRRERIGAHRHLGAAAVTSENILKHERALQDIADANGDTRSSGTPGYDASADYVAGLLVDAGYQVTRQLFTYELFVETADPVLDLTSPDQPAYTPGEDFITMEYSGAGTSPRR